MPTAITWPGQTPRSPLPVAQPQPLGQSRVHDGERRSSSLPAIRRCRISLYPEFAGNEGSGRLLQESRIPPVPQIRATRHCPCLTNLFPPACPRSDLKDNSATGQVSPDRTANSRQHGCLQRLCLMFEHGAHLLFIDTGEPFDELRDGGSASKVFIQRGYWNPRAGKHPGTADLSRCPLNGIACVPVCQPDCPMLSCAAPS